MKMPSGMVIAVLLCIGAQLVLSAVPVFITENGLWNRYCNSTLYAKLSGDTTAIILKPSPSNQNYRLYGSCLLSFGRSKGILHLDFLQYPALHKCANGALVLYEIVGGIEKVLWDGQCMDAPYRWMPRRLQTTTNDLWIRYRKEVEWPEILPFRQLSFELRIATSPLKEPCDTSYCKHQGVCSLRPSSPPSNLTSFQKEKFLHACKCRPSISSCDHVESSPNPCTSMPCMNQGMCVVNIFSSFGFYCICPPPFEGLQCQKYPNICLSNTNICGEHGACTPVLGGVQCNCHHQWIGPRCDVLSPCISAPCQHNGSCLSTSLTSYTCICHESWVGKNCAERKNKSYKSTKAKSGSTMSVVTAVSVVSSTQPDNFTNLTIAELTDLDVESNSTTSLIIAVSVFMFLMCCLVVWLSIDTSATGNKEDGKPETSSGSPSLSSGADGENKWKAIVQLMPSATTLYFERDSQMLPTVEKSRKRKSTSQKISSVLAEFAKKYAKSTTTPAKPLNKFLPQKVHSTVSLEKNHLLK